MTVRGDRQRDVTAPTGAAASRARGSRGEPGPNGRTVGDTAAKGGFFKPLLPEEDCQVRNIAPHWYLFAACMAGGLLFIAAMSRSLPDGLTGAIALAAICLAAASPLFAWLERRLSNQRHCGYAIMIMAKAVPALMFSWAVGAWADTAEHVQWEMTVAVLASLSLGAATLLNGRLLALVAVSLGLWAGASAYHATAAPLVALVIAGASGIWISAWQAKRDARQRRIEAKQERDRQQARAMLNEYEATGQGWFWETDRRGTITYISPRIAKLLKVSVDALRGQPFTDLFILDAAEQESERTLNFHLSTRSSFQDLPVLAATSEAEERWWSVSGRPVLDKYKNFMGFRGSGSDLTETRKSQRHVTQLARFDSLTKLANRFQMSEWLEKILGSPRESDRVCSVFLLDLDRFKQVNDTMGHPAGDTLLKQVSERLTSTVGEAGRVGRLGGDEFQVILPGRVPRVELGHLAQRIIDNLSQPYSIDGQRVTIGASVGIAVHPDDGVASDELIRSADLALYAAKDGGRGRYHFYAEDLHSEAQERQQLEQDLRDAIAAREFELHYQPQVHTMTEKISGFEALLRWNHPVHGYLSPAKFVPIAEDTGLITHIGEWALRTACADLANWPESIRVAVNVSAIQFANPALPSIVTNAIASARIDPSRLELEITESVFLNDDKSTSSMFTALKGIGVRLALDDFGTGYSSLGYLKQAPFDKIKIDQSFVSGATVDGSRNGAIISAIVNIAEALGMETIAEGVETLDELDLIRMLGCSHIQGYIYDKPLTPEAAAERISKGMSAIAHGPRSSRAPRQTMLRKVVLAHGKHKYNGTIRNISTTGAMIEGLWNVPPGTEFDVQLSKGYVIKATARWSKEDRMGVEFAVPLELDDNGGVSVVAPRARRDPAQPVKLRKAG